MTMDTSTGEIKAVKPGELAPAGHIELRNFPNPNCPLCKGSGKMGPKVVGNKHKRRFVFLPCSCTDPVEGPEMKSLKAMEAAGELNDPPKVLAMPGVDHQQEMEAVARAAENAQTTAIVVLP